MGQWIYAPECGVDFDDWAAAKAYNPWDRYGQAKLANLLHAKELQRRLDAQGAKGVTAVAVHPGVIMETGLTRHFGLAMIGQMMAYPRMTWASVVGGTKTTAQGAGAIMYAAVAPVEGTPAAAGAAGTVTPGGYYAECALETSWVHPRAADTELAAKLWRVSDETVDAALRA
jgi:retinol dehydrogenase 12